MSSREAPARPVNSGVDVHDPVQRREPAGHPAAVLVAISVGGVVGGSIPGCGPGFDEDGRAYRTCQGHGCAGHGRGIDALWHNQEPTQAGDPHPL